MSNIDETILVNKSLPKKMGYFDYFFQTLESEVY